MTRNPMATRLTATALIALLLLNATACTKWRVVDQPTPESLNRGTPTHYRLTLHNGEVRTVGQLERVADSLITYRYFATRDSLVRQRTAIPVDSVRRIEGRVNNPGATGAGVGFMVALVAGVVALATVDLGL